MLTASEPPLLPPSVYLDPPPSLQAHPCAPHPTTSALSQPHFVLPSTFPPSQATAPAVRLGEEGPYSLATPPYVAADGGALLSDIREGVSMAVGAAPRIIDASLKEGMKQVGGGCGRGRWAGRGRGGVGAWGGAEGGWRCWGGEAGLRMTGSMCVNLGQWFQGHGKGAGLPANQHATDTISL